MTNLQIESLPAPRADQCMTETSADSCQLTFRAALSGVCLFISSLAIAVNADADAFLFEPSAVPGGIAVVDIGPIAQDLPVVEWHDRPVAVIQKDGQAFAIVGIPLSSKPGIQTLQITDQSGTATGIGKKRGVRDASGFVRPGRFSFDMYFREVSQFFRRCHAGSR